ncbi:glycosyltransferase family 4 protein [Pseudoalteromonas distincta]|uniref:glycosyltransferase family 4 protein n=1 Tax=Pseudoalteromonas distincta TaxID=77608 RepID=UPI0039EA5D65
MKIVIVNLHKDDSSGGSEIQCGIIADELSDKGHNVVYIAPREHSSFNPSRSYKYQLINTESNSISLAREIIKTKPDVVYWRSYKKHILLPVFLLWLKKIPVVFAVSHLHDLDVSIHFKHRIEGARDIARLLRNVFYTLKQKLAYKFVKQLISLNTDFLDLLPGRRIIYVPNAMSLSNDKPFEWSKPFCVWVANLKSPKQPEFFVKLAKEFEESGIDFLMVGRYHSEFSEYGYIKDMAKTPKNFYYLGEVSPNQVNSILASSILHIHTCLPEGFGNIFIQAWFNKIPSISLDFNPCSLLNGDFGIYCDGDYKMLSEATRKLTLDSELRERMGEKAYAYAIENHSVVSLGNNIERILSDVVYKKRK